MITTFPKEQADYFTAKDRAVFDGSQTVDIPEEPIKTRQGIRILHTKKIPLFNSSGKPSYLLGISEDITERKRADEERLELIREQSARVELQRAIALRDEFLSVASHELKTPVTSLKLQLQMAQRELKSSGPGAVPDKLVKVISTSVRQVNRLTALIEDLLDVSRIQAGKLSLHYERTNVSEMLKELSESIQDQALESGSRLVVHPSDALFAYCDRFRLEQVVINLLSNALKYGAGQPIEVLLCRNGDFAKIEVKDHGMGIEESRKAKIFERFERAVSSRNISGLGLGLYIARQIVDAHHGKIYVESVLGQGSRFVVELPLEVPKGEFAHVIQ